MNKYPDVVVFDSHYKTELFVELTKRYLTHFIYVNEGYCRNHVLKFLPHHTKLMNISDREFDRWHPNNLIGTKQRVEFWLTSGIKELELDAVDLILQDRKLRDLDFREVGTYLFWIYIKVSEMAKCLKPSSIVVMEPTWAHELLAARILEKYGHTVYQPKKCKLRHKIFYWFIGVRNERYVINQDTVGVMSLRETVAYASSTQVPNFKRDANRNTSVSWITNNCFRMMRELIMREKNRFIHPPFFSEFVRKLKSIFRSLPLSSKKIQSSWLSLDLCLSQKFVYFPLHYEPEAMINVIGEELRYQIETVRRLRSLLDPAFHLIVKEHPHCFGNRGLDFYRELESIEGVSLAKLSVNSRDLIKSASLTIAIAGTAALEALLIGKRAVTLKRMYFSDSSEIELLDLYSKDAKRALDKIITKLADSNSTISDSALSELDAGGFIGSVSDRWLESSSVSEENLTLVRRSFDRVIAFHCKKRA